MSEKQIEAEERREERKNIRQTATATSRQLIVSRSFHFAFVSFRKCNFIFKRMNKVCSMYKSYNGCVIWYTRVTYTEQLLYLFEDTFFAHKQKKREISWWDDVEWEIESDYTSASDVLNIRIRPIVYLKYLNFFSMNWEQTQKPNESTYLH